MTKLPSFRKLTDLAREGRESGAPPVRAPTPQEREVQLGQPVWSDDGARAVLFARAADNKDRWILALDPATGKTRVLAADHDDAWAGGPGGNTIGWMKNEIIHLWQGHPAFCQQLLHRLGHLYAVSWDGGEPRALTAGNWEVLNVRQSKDKSHFYVTASKDSPYENHLYELTGEPGAPPATLTRLTRAPGRHVATLSPDEHWIADVYSYTNHADSADLFRIHPEGDLHGGAERKRKQGLNITAAAADVGRAGPHMRTLQTEEPRR